MPATDDRTALAEAALRECMPHELPSTVTSVVGKHFGASSCRILLADYGLRFLAPVPTGAGEAVPVDGTAAGRAFASQEPVVVGGDPVTVYLPVSDRGERAGVLHVCLPAPGGTADPRDVEALAGIAAAVAQTLMAVERDTDLYAVARRGRPLTLAAEIQWDLLPRRSAVRPEFHLGAQLEPAYTVCGDNFDWSADGDRLSIGVINGEGTGMPAATLTALAVQALRHARRTGADLADQAMLANEAVWAVHGGRRALSALLLQIDLATGQVQAVDAGSPLAFLTRAGRSEQISLEPQFTLGALEDTVYTEQSFRLEPGDRLTVVSDGVHAALSKTQEGTYRERALARILRATPLAPAPEAARMILRDLAEHVGLIPLEDDAVVVCLDWFGR
ncbi:PP2C family protein-serine/threonine phosphatase [Streptomyces thermolineatus]|uniref:PP2C family protein-serine/threonine phosphatase n=1 Tax=Streptomyces thermolineatus TaxID=44033 RepID=A0ABP5ZEA7_9ACTN